MTDHTERRPLPAAQSRWTITLFTVREIPIRVHFTFFLFVAYLVGIDSMSEGLPAMARLALVLLVFLCVLLHELSHAFAARWFGIGTRDIVLYPFGGIATVTGHAKPKAEFFIAAAGPLSNVALALLCLPLYAAADRQHSATILLFLDQFYMTNLILCVFNLLPAFPMDGGRMFRAALAVFGFARATFIATRMSQVLSVVMAIYGIATANIILVLIAALVFSTATQEQLSERTRGISEGYSARDVMTDAETLVKLTHGVTVSQALTVALKSLQTHFPVMHGEEVLGLIRRDALIEAGATAAEESYISGLMDRDAIKVDVDTPLKEVLDLLRGGGDDCAIVLSSGNFVGLIYRDQLYEYIMVQDFRRRSQESARDLDETV